VEAAATGATPKKHPMAKS